MKNRTTTSLPQRSSKGHLALPCMAIGLSGGVEAFVDYDREARSLGKGSMG